MALFTSPSSWATASDWLIPRTFAAVESEKGPQNNEMDTADTFKMSDGSVSNISFIMDV